MNAHLTITAKGKSSFFFGSDCTLEPLKDKAQIDFTILDDENEPKDRIVLGVHTDKLIVYHLGLKDSDFIPVDIDEVDEDGEDNEEMILISTLSNEPNRGVLHIGDMTFYMSGNGYKATISKDKIECQTQAFIAYDGTKTDLLRITITCTPCK